MIYLFKVENKNKKYKNMENLENNYRSRKETFKVDSDQKQIG